MGSQEFRVILVCTGRFGNGQVHRPSVLTHKSPLKASIVFLTIGVFWVQDVVNKNCCDAAVKCKVFFAVRKDAFHEPSEFGFIQVLD